MGSRAGLDGVAWSEQHGLLLLVSTEVDGWIHWTVLEDLQWMVFEVLIHEQLALINNKVMSMDTIASVDVLRVYVLRDRVWRVPPVLKRS